MEPVQFFLIFQSLIVFKVCTLEVPFCFISLKLSKMDSIFWVWRKYIDKNDMCFSLFVLPFLLGRFKYTIQEVYCRGRYCG